MIKPLSLACHSGSAKQLLVQLSSSLTAMQLIEKKNMIAANTLSSYIMVNTLIFFLGVES